MPKIDLNITDLSSGGTESYQVRIAINKKTFSKTFNWRACGGKRKALSAARSWRDAIYDAHNLPQRFKSGDYWRYSRLTHATSAKRTTGVLGVCRSTTFERRCKDGELRVSYCANYRVCEDGKLVNKDKRFYVGRESKITPMMELAAFRAARDFRRKYERAANAGKGFRPGPEWASWRKYYGL